MAIEGTAAMSEDQNRQSLVSKPLSWAASVRQFWRDFKDRLVIERFEQRVAKVIEKESFDQLMHSLAATAVRERDEFVFDSRFSSPRAFDAFKEWRCGEFHI